MHTCRSHAVQYTLEQHRFRNASGNSGNGTTATLGNYSAPQARHEGQVVLLDTPTTCHLQLPHPQPV